MAETTERDPAPRAGVDWRHLIIALAVGGVPTAVCFLFGWWWPGTVFLLLTLLAMAFAFPHELYPTAFTVYAVFAIAWVSGSLIAQRMPLQGEVPSAWEQIMPPLAGLVLGLLIVSSFWLAVVYVTARWLLSISDSLGVSMGQAFRFVASRLFDTHQQYLVVENGKLAGGAEKGLLARFGGPGLLIVRPGNVAVLERGKETRFVGPGTEPLRRLESLKEPAEGKGILDLRSQGASGIAENVRTLDGIRLDIQVGTSWQIEPQSATDARPGTRFAGGDATTKVYGAPEYPVYEAILRKAVFNTPSAGPPAMFPNGPINTLRDVVGTYNLDQIFSLQDPDKPEPEQRTIHRIEQEVKKRVDMSGAGVMFKGIDIREITIPDDVDRQWIKRWQTPIAGRLRVQEAEAERDALVETSKGRAESLRRVEDARTAARTRAVTEIVRPLLDQLNQAENEGVVRGLVDIMRYVTTEVARDEEMALRYVEAMQAVIGSEGAKTMIISPPQRGGQVPASLLPGTGSTPQGRRGGAPGGPDQEDEPAEDQQID